MNQKPPQPIRKEPQPKRPWGPGNPPPGRPDILPGTLPLFPERKTPPTNGHKGPEKPPSKPKEIHS